MRFNLISNISNGCGLQQDYELLRQELEARGHTVQGIQFNAKPWVVKKADVNIFLEVVNPAALSMAPVQWAVPNPEWWFVQWDQIPWDLVLAKTHDCEHIFKDKVGARCQYVGWTARDLYDPTIPRQRKFLHVAGKSQFKNTRDVVMGCQHAGVPVTVVGEHTGQHRRVPEAELRVLMNSHFCHVMPSAYEGYGQVLHEAMAVGQIIITTNAPPMNELHRVFLVPSIGTRSHHAGILHKVSPLDIAKRIQDVLAMSPEAVSAYQEASRERYHVEVASFKHQLDKLVGKEP